jgi:hypothetical protein
MSLLAYFDRTHPSLPAPAPAPALAFAPAGVVADNLHAQHPEYGFPDPSRIEIQRSIFARIQCRL